MAKKSKKAVRKNAKKKSKSKSTAIKKAKKAKAKKAKKQPAKKRLKYKEHKPKAEAASKQPKFKTITGLTEEEKKIKLMQKIHLVMCNVPRIECTLQEVSAEDDQPYYYTAADTVFKIYREQFIKIGLNFFPVLGKTGMDGRFYEAAIQYEIIDIETGYGQKVIGFGQGANGVWSLNSAQTVAKKQAMLATFNASYGPPEPATKVVRKQVEGFNPEQAIAYKSAAEANQDMETYFGQKLE